MQLLRAVSYMQCIPACLGALQGSPGSHQPSPCLLLVLCSSLFCVFPSLSPPSQVGIKVFQGEREMAADNNMLGQFDLVSRVQAVRFFKLTCR